MTKKFDFSKAQEVEAGAQFNFTKLNPTVKRLQFDLHWECDKDADVSVIIGTGERTALKGVQPGTKPDDQKFRGLVYYKNLTAPGVEHTGDARESDGDADSPEETILVNPMELEKGARNVTLVATTFPDDDAGTGPAVPFSEVKDCRVNIIDPDANTVLYTYALSGDFGDFTSVELIRADIDENKELQITALATGVGNSAIPLNDIAKEYKL